MSFYGKIKRVDSSPFIFDRYYPSRKAMDDSLKNNTEQSDGVYVGRYVLVKYNCHYTTNSDGKQVLEFVDKYANSSTGNEKPLSQTYINNRDADLAEYRDTYDATVWQKIYTEAKADGQPSEKYILIAELNADAPMLDFKTVTPLHKDSENSPEVWAEPTTYATTDDYFMVSFPNALKLHVDDLSSDFYGKQLVENPSSRKTYNASYQNGVNHDNALTGEHNYIKWVNMLGDNEVTSGDIDGKKLKVQLYAFGQIISDMYDVLYGRPANGEEGTRPYFTNDIGAVLASNSGYNKGLVGILSSIASEYHGDNFTDVSGYHTYGPGQYYYLISRWGDPQDNTNSFIENIPRVIGASEASGGSGQLSHYYIDFENANGDYLQEF